MGYIKNTTIKTTAKFKVDDPIIEINGELTDDLGIIFNRKTTGNNIAILWDNSAQEFVLVQTTADGESSGDLTFNSYSKLHVGELQIADLAFPTIDGNDGQVLTTDGLGNVAWEDPPVVGAVAWGTITGTVSDQTDLQSALDAANAAGGNALVIIRPGTYTEDLTLYDS